MKKYAPTDDKEEEVKNIFDEGLDNVCDLIPTNKVQILLGDFNAQNRIGNNIQTNNWERKST